MTKHQAAALELIREYGAKGTCIRYIWMFQSNGKIITREVKALERKNLITISYYSGGEAAVNMVAA